VDENEVSLYNRDQYTIGFHSSDEVEMTLDSVVFDSYRLAMTRSVKITEGTEEAPDGVFSFRPALQEDDQKAVEAMMLSLADKFSDFKAELELVGGTNGGYIHFSHEITERMIAPHKIYITIKHKGDNSGAFLDHIVLTQYPSIYIVADKSNGNLFINGYHSYRGFTIYILFGRERKFKGRYGIDLS
jgi:hypothetical protein